MQEHYESANPRFRKFPFTLEEYMDWYAANQPDRESRPENEQGHFTYTQDWSGFNIPSDIIAEFHFFFPDKSVKERALLKGIFEAVDEFNRRNGVKYRKKENVFNWPFYVIGTYDNDPDNDDGSTVAHEIRHGLFFCDEQYRRDMTAGVKKHAPASFIKSLAKAGYGNNTLIDEAHAYALTGYRTEEKVTKQLKNLSKELKKIEAKYL